MKTLATSLLLLAATASLAEEWKLERDRDGVTVHTRRVEGIAFKEYKGATRVDARLSTLIAVFNDIEASTEWVDKCERMELVERVSPTETITYAYTPAPWPVKDRDAVVRSIIVQDPETKIVTITQRATPDHLPRERKAVRVERIESQWTFKPMEDGAVELTYQVLTDPGGGLPAWLVNAVSVSQPFNTVKGMREMAAREKYRDATYDYISEP